MAHVLSLRDDYTGDDLRGLARSTDSAKQARRLLALSLIYDGWRCWCADGAGLGSAFQRQRCGRFAGPHVAGYAASLERGSPQGPGADGRRRADALSAWGCALAVA